MAAYLINDEIPIVPLIQGWIMDLLDINDCKRWINLKARNFWPNDFARIACSCRFPVVQTTIGPAKMITPTVVNDSAVELKLERFQVPAGLVFVYYGYCEHCSTIFWSLVLTRQKINPSGVFWSFLTKMDIPKDKSFPSDSVQCDQCGGHGCKDCENRGWFTPSTHSGGRHCAYFGCNKPLAPGHVAVYCSNECAFLDA